jgi:hypothetical protein
VGTREVPSTAAELLGGEGLVHVGTGAQRIDRETRRVRSFMSSPFGGPRSQGPRLGFTPLLSILHSQDLSSISTNRLIHQARGPILG